MSEGRVVGDLHSAEDATLLHRILKDAPELATTGQVQLLTHADIRHGATNADKQRERQAMLERLEATTLKRYVFEIHTSAGPRIVKIAETRGLGNALLGSFGSSVARREHHYQLQTEALDAAATHSCGFLELRRGPRLIRALQVQTLLDPDLPTLEHFLPAQLDRYGDQTFDQLGAAIARMHALPFFHADLKGFHAFVDGVTAEGGRPDSYRLRWIDLARVSFHMTRRKRIINLYQALRFVVPERPEAQQIFLAGYCRQSGWYRDDPAAALTVVRKFLAYKLRTHPHP